MEKDSTGRSRIRDAKKEINNPKVKDELFIANSQAFALIIT